MNHSFRGLAVAMALSGMSLAQADVKVPIGSTDNGAVFNGGSVT